MTPFLGVFPHKFRINLEKYLSVKYLQREQRGFCFVLFFVWFEFFFVFFLGIAGTMWPSGRWNWNKSLLTKFQPKPFHGSVDPVPGSFIAVVWELLSQKSPQTTAPTSPKSWALGIVIPVNLGDFIPINCSELKNEDSINLIFYLYLYSINLNSAIRIIEFLILNSVPKS